MSDKVPRWQREVPPILQVRAGLITDPQEVARIEEQHQRQKERDTEYLIFQVIDQVFEPPFAHRRDLLAVILGLVEHLTPEQRRTLHEKLRATPVAANGQAAG